MASLDDRLNALTFNEYEFAKKKPGEGGQKHLVKANFTNIKIARGTVIFQYNIEIDVPELGPGSSAGDQGPARPGGPERRLKQQRRVIQESNFEIFKKFFAEFKTDVFKNKDGSTMTEPVFDGRKIFYTRQPITLNDGTRGTYEVKMKVPEKKFPQRFTIKVFTPPDAHRIDLGSFAENSRSLQAAEKELQALDLIISYGAKHHNLVLNQKMFIRKRDLLSMRREERENIRFSLGELKEGSFGHHQVS